MRKIPIPTEAIHIKQSCLRPRAPQSLEEARRMVESFVRHYNEERLHSALGYITPKDKLEGHEQNIFAERDRKLEAARESRRQRRLAARTATGGKEVQTVC